MNNDIISQLSESEVLEVMRDYLYLEQHGHLDPEAFLRKVAEALPGGDNIGNMTTVALLAFKRYALYWVCNATNQDDSTALEVLEEALAQNTEFFEVSILEND